jgi:uncharacterized membrane protein
MTRALAGALLLLAAGVASVAGHQGHASPRPSSSPAASASPRGSAAGEAEIDSSEAAILEEGGAAPVAALVEETEPAAEEPGAMQVIPWETAFTSHLHNKIVHFPLAFGLAAAVLMIAGPRWPAYAPAGRLLLIVAAVAAVAAYLTGGAQEAVFEDSPFHAVVEVHEAFGTATAIALCGGVALTFWAPAQRFLPVFAVLLLLLLTATGFLGGVLSHS